MRPDWLVRCSIVASTASAAAASRYGYEPRLSRSRRLKRSSTQRPLQARLRRCWTHRKGRLTRELRSRGPEAGLAQLAPKPTPPRDRGSAESGGFQTFVGLSGRETVAFPDPSSVV